MWMPCVESHLQILISFMLYPQINNNFSTDSQTRPARADRWARKTSWISLLMFVIGATSAIDYSLVGRVTVAETIAFAFIPYFWLFSGGVPINSHFKKAVGLLSLLFIGIAIGDFINQTPFLFSARALARPVFMLGFLLFFIPVLMRDPLSLVYMVYGRVLTGIINYFRPSQFESAGAADASSYVGIVFRLEPLIGAFAVALAVYSYPRSRVLASAAFLSGGLAVALVGGARSSILVWALAAVLIFLIKIFKTRQSRRIDLTKTRLISLIAVVAAALSAVYIGYIWAAPRGYLGNDQRQKMIEQQNTVFGASPVGLVLGGRPQVYGAILGILDRPLIGFGSWRHDLTSYYVIDAIASVGTDPEIINRLNQGVTVGGAGHSVLFQAWVENGVLPAVAYLCIYAIMLRVLLFNIRYDNRLTPYFVATGVAFSWSFLFSPPGLGLRFSVGLFLAFYVVYMDRRKALSRVALVE